jgi:hypothetical protein
LDNTKHAQILFLSGLPLIIGPTKTFYFFSRKEKWRGTLCFFGGMHVAFLYNSLIVIGGWLRVETMLFEC